MSAAQAPRRIDAHQHFWRVARGDYHWMPPDGPLHRDYLPEDLRPLNEAAGIAGTIAVQAAQTVAETEWLLELASDPASCILGVVGWVPLDDPADPTLDRLAATPECVGVRPMLQDLDEDDWISTRIPREQFERVAGHGMVFEVLSLPRQLPYVVRALESMPPDLTVVIDHLSKPDYRTALGAWAGHISTLASRPQTFCKLSGIVTEVGDDWRSADVRQHAEFVLEAFGPERVLFGSDWPVCLKVAAHGEVVALAEELVAHLGENGRAAVFGANAERVYGV